MDIPIELFLGFIGISIALAVFGFVRNPQIPACLVMGGMFILFLSVATDNVIMGKIPTSSVTSGSTVNYNFVDNLFEFTEMPKVIFALVGSMIMLVGGLMVMKS